MIYGMARDIGTNLTSQGWPCEIQYDGAVLVAGAHELRADFRRSRLGGDAVEFTRTHPANPSSQGIRWISAEVELFASSSQDGARSNEHQDLVDALADALAAAIRDWASAARSAVRFTGGTGLMLLDKDRSGERYLITFQIARGMRRRDYGGAARPSGAAVDVDLSVDVRREAASEE